MVLEPVGNDLAHIIYPLTLPNRTILQGDQEFLTHHRRKRSSLLNQIDYDEEGNEITDTVQFDQLEEYSQSIDDEADEENELSNAIDDDDVVISDVYSEIEDYDVHPPPIVTEAKSLQEAEENPSNNRTNLETQDAVDVDGFSVDKLWEGITISGSIIVRDKYLNSCYRRRITGGQTKKARFESNSGRRFRQISRNGSCRRSHSH